MTLYNFLLKSIDFWQKHSGLTNLKTHTIYAKLIDSQSLVIDLGANVGQFSAEINREFNCKCYAIEAVPAVYSQIPENNLLKKFNYAISDQNQTINLYLSENRECHSVSEEAASIYGLQGVISVEAITLDTFLNNHKIDSRYVRYTQQLRT